MLLSVLICTIPQRDEMFDKLLLDIQEYSNKYFNEDELEIWCDNDINKTIGKKRNDLLDSANGKYICFIDDDDSISEDYFEHLRKGIDSDSDCCSLRGIITWDGKNPELFEHSIKYKHWATTNNTIKYERFPNHLNCIKSSIAKEFKFQEINFGEDMDWAVQINNSGLIKTEYFIDKIIYNYQYVTKK